MNKEKRIGFTLVELLVVISIIGILIGMLIPAVQAVREAACKTQCANNVRQIAQATISFHATYNKLPPARWKHRHASWYTLILPFMDMKNAHDLWHLDRPYGDAVNKQARELSSPLFTCPTRRSPSISSVDSVTAPGAVGDYAGNAGSNTLRRNGKTFPDPMHYPAPLYNDGVIISSSRMDGRTKDRIANGKLTWSSNISFESVRDGLSSTILVGEKHVLPATLGEVRGDGSIYDGTFPNNSVRAGGSIYPIARDSEDISSCDVIPGFGGCHNFGSWHSGICQFAMCDGSLKVLRVDIDPKVLESLASRNDGGVIPSDL